MGKNITTFDNDSIHRTVTGFKFLPSVQGHHVNSAFKIALLLLKLIYIRLSLKKKVFLIRRTLADRSSHYLFDGKIMLLVRDLK